MNRPTCCKAKRVQPENRPCVVCEQSPVLNLTDMCGPCTFGEAACLDPNEWTGWWHEDGCLHSKGEESSDA